jgi:putative spermidine/putrescine transport system ATP-binding protein
MGFLELINVHKTFGSVPVVEDFDVKVDRGEFVALLGPSGCGKTTTLRMVAGFVTPTSGRIQIAGLDITHQPANQRNVGMVFQSYALFPNMTVADNIAFGLKIRHVPEDRVRGKVDDLLALIHLPDKGRQYPHQLSGGQQQRVALARALAIEPQVLLLDEPLSALDAKIRVELRAEIRRIQRQMGITTLYVTHDQEEAMSLSDRVVVMSHGRIEQVGTPSEIYDRPQTVFVGSFVGTLNSLPCVVVNATRGQLTFGDQPVTVASAIPVPDGSPVSLMLRPEELTLHANGAANQLSGTVEAVSFLGSVIRVAVNLGEVTATVDLFNERSLEMPQVGRACTVSFPPHAGRLVMRNQDV